MKIDNVSNVELLKNELKQKEYLMPKKVIFSDIISNEIENMSLYEFEKNIEKKHNAKINSLTEFNTSINNVIIGEETLSKMKNDNLFREKILKIIDYNCSDLGQKNLRSLSPPVKSSGVIIYPDGSYLCWVESIYSEKNQSSKENNNENKLMKKLMGIDSSGMEQKILNGNFEDIVEEIVSLIALAEIKVPKNINATLPKR